MKYILYECKSKEINKYLLVKQEENYYLFKNTKHQFEIHVINNQEIDINSKNDAGNIKLKLKLNCKTNQEISIDGYHGLGLEIPIITTHIKVEKKRTYFEYSYQILDDKNQIQETKEFKLLKEEDYETRINN